MNLSKRKRDKDSKGSVKGGKKKTEEKFKNVEETVVGQ